MVDSGHTALLGRAEQCLQRGNLNEAERLYLEILKSYPRHGAALFGVGVVAVRRGAHKDALQPLRKAIKSNARDPGPHFFLGLSLQALAEHQDAIASFKRVLELQRNHAESHYHLGVSQAALGRIEEALASFNRALRLKPDFPDALADRGNALADLGNYDEALAAYGMALSIAPEYAAALDNRGATLMELGRYDEAIEDFSRAVALQPDFASAHFDESLARLVKGDFATGWRKYEWRWKDPALGQEVRNFAVPRWDGKASLAGKTVLVHAEQGLGDTIQFVRYLPKLAALGATVILEVQPQLAKLVKGIAGSSTTLSRGQALPPFDYHCPLLSLPMVFATDLESIPRAESYLAADPAIARQWQDRLGPRTRTRVGLAWSGSTWHKNDRHRSIPAALITRLTNPSMDFICLQKDIRDSDRAALRQCPAIRDDSRDLKDFSVTAGLIDCLDVVISVDTAIAHLAGALGKPLWILLPFAPDWRWLLGRRDSPWDPSARLFRQKQPGGWEGVMSDVARALDEWSR